MNLPSFYEKKEPAYKPKELNCRADQNTMKSDREKQRRRINRSDLPVYKWRTIYWGRHRESVAKMKPKVDTSCPQFSPTMFTGLNIKYRQRLANFIRIDLENAVLAQKITRMVSEKSQCGTQLDTTTTKCINNRGHTRLVRQTDIVLENMGQAQRLADVHPIYSRKKQIKWYNQQEYYMGRLSRYPLYWQSRACEPFERRAFNNTFLAQQPVVYFDFEVKNGPIGRVVIELDRTAAPVAVENFVALVNGKGKKGFHCRQLDKMWPGTYWSAGRGAQGRVKAPFPPKKYRIKHSKSGILSLINDGEGMFDAEFMITARELEPLNDQNLAIGTVSHGMEFLESLSKYLKKNSLKFQTPVFIIDTGELDPNKPFPPYPYDENEIAESEVETDGENDENGLNRTESRQFDYDAKKDKVF